MLYQTELRTFNFGETIDSVLHPAEQNAPCVRWQPAKLNSTALRTRLQTGYEAKQMPGSRASVMRSRPPGIRKSL